MGIINFPSKKRYLTGIDWIIHVLDYITNRYREYFSDSSRIRRLSTGR
ncbi:MAG: hypothetical protein JRG74_02340 [Deltaproteobacteria bacterium]|nr:hypothetical protein [Deltaproteobacteria bacterium]